MRLKSVKIIRSLCFSTLALIKIHKGILLQAQFTFLFTLIWNYSTVLSWFTGNMSSCWRVITSVVNKLTEQAGWTTGNLLHGETTLMLGTQAKSQLGRDKHWSYLFPHAISLARFTWLFHLSHLWTTWTGGNLLWKRLQRLEPRLLKL